MSQSVALASRNIEPFPVTASVLPAVVPTGLSPAGPSAPGGAVWSRWVEPPPSVSSMTTNGLAVAALVLGIVGFVVSYVSLFGILPVVFGHVARRQIFDSRGRQSGGGLAMAGLILGYVQLALLVLLLVLFGALTQGLR